MNNMKILVVNPPNKPFNSKNILIEPIDTLQIATVISTYYSDIEILDMDRFRVENNLVNYIDRGVVVLVFDYQIPLHNTETIYNIFEITNGLKDKDCKVIVIGKTPGYYHKLFLENNVDVVIEGQAEYLINNVINNIDKKDVLGKLKGLYFTIEGQVIYTGENNKPVKLIDLPYPNRDLVNVGDYIDVRSIITSRGCNSKCNFCAVHGFFKGWNAKSSKQVIDEIQYLANNYKAKKVLFLDDNATVDKKRMTEICEGISSLGLNLGCLSSIKNYDEELFQKMYESGFKWVHFGIESGSEEILKKMNKYMSLNDTTDIIKSVKNMGFRVRTSWILDYPGSNEDDLEKTFNLIMSLDTHEVRLHYIAKRVGTSLFEYGKYVEDQYIHRSKSDNEVLSVKVSKFIEKLKSRGYDIIDCEDDIDYSRYNKDSKLVSLTPMRYGVGWNG